MKDGKIEAEGDKNIINSKLIKDIYEIDVDICKYKEHDVVVFK